MVKNNGGLLFGMGSWPIQELNQLIAIGCKKIINEYPDELQRIFITAIKGGILITYSKLQLCIGENQYGFPVS